ncbi:MAG: DsbA family protein [Aerococcus sp.]|nr:DsbA family protein [Aerococcus sp.]
MLDNERVHRYAPHSSKSAHEHLFELFLFINPLDEESLEAEKELLHFIEQSKANVYFRLICYHDYPCIQALRQKLQRTYHQTEACNELFSIIYQMALAYKAALFQGKKPGRKMLLAMQHYFVNEKHPYSTDAMLQIAKENGLDTDMWLEDLHSDRVKRDYQEDVQLAHQMNITVQPSLVIFDSLNFKYGLKVEESITASDIEDLLNDFEASTDELLDTDVKSHCPLHALPNHSYH